MKGKWRTKYEREEGVKWREKSMISEEKSKTCGEKKEMSDERVEERTNSGGKSKRRSEDGAICVARRLGDRSKEGKDLVGGE
ncbi:hypothetical protein Pmani_039851 [Petrolisthes manimaculis]|uniref:Uncharacterized protein n=1 Tax=Petrolisthes manimaculis TaxID=1843537 RepID=A0AAE1NDC8_9EUCA|nr:hypothetical protein Pmani_039851 [Petrolisthes manimaculis]